MLEHMDNIALRKLSEECKLGYDLFGELMAIREKQAQRMAEFLVSFGNDVVIVGKSFKPGTDQLDGSPSILVGSYLTSMLKKVYYEKAPDNEKPYTYLLAHWGIIKKPEVNPGSVVVDPYRRNLSFPECEVVQYGNTRI